MSVERYLTIPIRLRFFFISNFILFKSVRASEFLYNSLLREGGNQLVVDIFLGIIETSTLNTVKLSFDKLEKSSEHGENNWLLAKYIYPNTTELVTYEGNIISMTKPSGNK